MTNERRMMKGKKLSHLSFPTFFDMRHVGFCPLVCAQPVENVAAVETVARAKAQSIPRRRRIDRLVSLASLAGQLKDHKTALHH